MAGGERAEAGRHAVDRLTGLGERLDVRARRSNPLEGVGSNSDVSTSAGDGHDLRRLERVLPESDGHAEVCVMGTVCRACKGLSPRWPDDDGVRLPAT